MDRKLHLIDIENLAGDAFDRHGTAAERLDDVLELAWQPGDLVTIASNARLWRRFAWHISVPHRFIVPPCGRNGADLALLGAAAELDLRSVSGLVIGSGDGIFAPLAAHAARLGAHVTVVACAGSISRTLRSAAHEVLVLSRNRTAAAA